MLHGNAAEQGADPFDGSGPPDGGRPLDIRHIVIGGIGAHPSRANGLHNVARCLAREQMAAGDRPEVVFLLPPGQESGDERDVPARRLKLTGPRFRGRVLRLTPSEVEALLHGAGPDTILHIHASREPLLIGLGRVLRQRGIPYVLTIHGRYSHIFDRHGRITRLLPALYLRTVERPLLEGAAFLQGITLAECHLLQRLAPLARVVPLPNAAYSSRLDGIPPPPDRRQPSAEFPVFGYCGRYAVQHKGLDLLLQGFALYRRGGGRGRLVLAGTGPERDRVAAMAAALALGDAVEIHGPLFGEGKRKAFRDWDFFVHPSRYDVLPTGCLEAALHGLPLVVSAEIGLEVHLARHHAGFLAEELTAQAVAGALQRAARLSPNAWRAMSSNAHRMALAIGDWTVIAQRLRRLYRTAGQPQAAGEELRATPSSYLPGISE